MFTWNFSETIETNASGPQVWKLWADAESWPAWDSELEWVSFDTPFAPGGAGEMKPVGGPKVRFTLTHVEENRRFCDVTSLPLTKIEFDHRYEANEEGGGRITHSVAMRGVLAPLFGRVIGRGIKRHLRSAMERLSEQAAVGTA